jgi:hypothetical protein
MGSTMRQSSYHGVVLSLFVAAFIALTSGIRALMGK